MAIMHAAAESLALPSGDVTGPVRGTSHRITFFDAFSEGLAICSRDGELLDYNSALGQQLDADAEFAAHCQIVMRAFASSVAQQLADRGWDRSWDAAISSIMNPASIPTRMVTTLAASYHLRGWPLPDCLVRWPSAIVVSVERGAPPSATVEQLRRQYALTRCEAHVALLLTERKTNDQIAAALHISPHTARHHTENTFRKLRVHRRTDVARCVATAAMAQRVDHR